MMRCVNGDDCVCIVMGFNNVFGDELVVINILYF